MGFESPEHCPVVAVTMETAPPRPLYDEAKVPLQFGPNPFNVTTEFPTAPCDTDMALVYPLAAKASAVMHAKSATTKDKNLPQDRAIAFMPTSKSLPE